MIRVLEKAESSLLSGFNYQFSELEKRYIEAKDNVKFLTTLERHFKHIRDGPLVQILDTLPSMMNALRMVWVISRHYKDDQRMEPLFGRIGWEIANRVSTMINMRTIFREPATKLITDAKAVLEKWKQSYMDMRQKIEESGRDNRWEFDRNKLFARTDYMAQRCGDLLYVAEMLRDMRAMLGPELKAVTGDAKGIDEVMSRVEALVVPLETAPFDLFDRRYQTSWEAAMGKFRENVAAINETLQKFMDDSFTKLRNAEGAFDLLQKFRRCRSRGRAGEADGAQDGRHPLAVRGRSSTTSTPSSRRTRRRRRSRRTSRRSPARSTGRTRSSCASARRSPSSRRWTRRCSTPSRAR